MARSDVHAPVNFDPTDYVWIGGFDNQAGDPGARSGQLDDYVEYGVRVQAYSPAGASKSALITLLHRNERPHGPDHHQCDHCGAHIRYVGVFRHSNGDYIAVGEQCANGRFTYDKATFDQLRKAAELDRKEQRILKAWTEYQETHTTVYIEENGDDVLYSVPWAELHASPNTFIIDVLTKGRRYGDLTDRQLIAIVRAYANDLKRASEPPKEEPNWLPVPTQKAFVIEGIVLTEKWVQSDYAPNGVHKCLVQVNVKGGALKLWGTVPSNLFNLGRGDKVRLTANIEPSKKDDTFGLFKRPRKAEILEEVA